VEEKKLEGAEEQSKYSEKKIKESRLKIYESQVSFK